MTTRASFFLALFALTLTGCSAVEGLFTSEDEKPPSPEAASAAPTATAKEATTASGTEEVVPGDWKVFVVLDTTTDNTFFAPEAALSRALEDTNIKLMRHTTRDPIEVKDAQGSVLGKVDVNALTDQKSGYIFAEEGRPANFISSASLPFVLQQASAYFSMEIRMNNGQRASGGLRMGPNGAGGGKGMGPKSMNPEMRQRIREHKVDSSALKGGKATHLQGGGAGGAAGGEGGTTEQ